MSCGPGKFNFNHPRFSMACSLHDKEYEIGQLPRREIDLRFLKNMLKVSKGLPDIAIALTLYLYVVFFGWIFFKRNKNA